MSLAPVGEPRAPTTLAQHVRGETRYAGDVPLPEDTLHAAIVTSPCAHGRLLGIDLQALARLPGVCGIVTAEDIPGHNDHSPIAGDDPIFTTRTVEYLGQSLCAVLAATPAQAQAAARAAAIDVAPLPAVLDLPSSIRERLTLGEPLQMRCGDPERGFADSAHVFSGALNIGAQEHFYLETQVAIASPTDDGGYKLLVATQNPSEVQRLVARALAVAEHAVQVHSQQVGGAFGGKETQPALLACIVALAARKSGRTVKLQLGRDDDMRLTGKRHAVNAEYRVGCDAHGVLQAVAVQFWFDCGRSFDLSEAVRVRALLHCDNAYLIPNLTLTACLQKTHKSSNTAFRGFGAPQATLTIECIIDEVARRLELDPLEVRRRNLYSAKRGCQTYYGMPVQSETLSELIEEMVRSARYHSRRQQLADFNARSPVLKRGIALMPAKYGISFNQTHLNQAGALVHVYTDGSVLVAHAGVELGQGLNTKMMQIAAAVFGVDLAQVRCAAVDTAAVPNRSPTAASVSSDLNGQAVLAAAATIRQRLVEFAAAAYAVAADTIRFDRGRVALGARSVPFAQLVAAAHLERVSLSATGHYRTPEIHFDPVTMTGRPFYYFVHGVVCCEVVLDVLTGESRLDRVDLIQDVGHSLNPAIDLGQIQGAFVQGLGWLLSEHIGHDATGALQELGPRSYAIPTSYDVPEAFHITLRDDPRHRAETIFRSKGIGEPPLLLAIGVWLALRDAMRAAVPAGTQTLLAVPATPDRVLAALHGLD